MDCMQLFHKGKNIQEFQTHLISSFQSQTESKTS